MKKDDKIKPHKKPCICQKCEERTDKMLEQTFSNGYDAGWQDALLHAAEVINKIANK